MNDGQRVQIDMQRIPVGTGKGAALLIVIVLVGLFLDLPGVRATAIGGGTTGILLGAALIWWRRRGVADHQQRTLGITQL